MNWYIQVSKTIDYQLTKLKIWKWDSFKFMICQNCIYYLQITEVRHIHERFLSGEALFKQKKGFSAPEKNVFESRNLQRYDKCLKKKNLCHKKFSLAGMTGGRLRSLYAFSDAFSYIFILPWVYNLKDTCNHPKVFLHNGSQKPVINCFCWNYLVPLIYTNESSLYLKEIRTNKQGFSL